MTSISISSNSSFDINRLKDKYLALNSTQDSIQTLSLWVLHHKAHCEKIVEIWLKVFKKSKSKQKLNLLYLANDVIQNSKKRNARIFVSVFKRALIEAIFNIKDDSIKSQVARILTILKDRKFYDKVFIDDLLEAIDKIEVTNEKAIKDYIKIKAPAPKIGLKKLESKSNNGNENFKPNDLFLEINKMDKLSRDMQNKESDVEKCLSNFDLNSKEWVKNYKDKVSGQRLDTNLENCSLKLESFIPFLEALTRDRNTLKKNVQKAIDHYATIYEEAKFVTMAYKKYGSRVTTVQQKVKINKEEFLGKVGKQRTSYETPSSTFNKSDEFAHSLLNERVEWKNERHGEPVNVSATKQLFEDLSNLVGSLGKESTPTLGLNSHGASQLPAMDIDLRAGFDIKLQDVDLRYPPISQTGVLPSTEVKGDSAQITDMELGYDEEDLTGPATDRTTTLDNRIDQLLFIKQDVDARDKTSDVGSIMKDVRERGDVAPDSAAAPSLLLLPPPPPPPPLFPPLSSFDQALLDVSTVEPTTTPSMDTTDTYDSHQNYPCDRSDDSLLPPPKPLDILTRLIGLNKSTPSINQSEAVKDSPFFNPDQGGGCVSRYQISAHLTPTLSYATLPVVYQPSTIRHDDDDDDSNASYEGGYDPNPYQSTSPRAQVSNDPRYSPQPETTYHGPDYGGDGNYLYQNDSDYLVHPTTQAHSTYLNLQRPHYLLPQIPNANNLPPYSINPKIPSLGSGDNNYPITGQNTFTRSSFQNRGTTSYTTPANTNKRNPNLHVIIGNNAGGDYRKG